ncbi:unnamed protein product [Phaeothamnion confervicola]
MATAIVQRSAGTAAGRRRLLIAQLTPDNPDAADGSNSKEEGGGKDEGGLERRQQPQPQRKGGDLALPHDGGLPLSYRSDNGTRDSEFHLDADEQNLNPYFDVVRRLSPAELIGRFVKTSSPRMQEAVRTTVLGLLGSLPRHAIETTAVSTGSALANLMFQLQMTGYMFKNAEYRLSLQSSLRATNALPPGAAGSDLMESSQQGAIATAGGAAFSGEEDVVVAPKPKISGKIKLTYENDQEIEVHFVTVEADAYLAELTGQVERLSSQLGAVKEQRETAVQRDLLAYIKSMPPEQISTLSQGMSPEVLEAMKILVDTVMRSMGVNDIKGGSIVQQPGGGMAHLIMWQLVVGYNLREMEAREEVRKRFEASSE